MSRSTTISSKAAAAFAALALCAPLAACTTPLDRAWGLSHHVHVAQSIANPDAGRHDPDARRPDGQSNDAALTKYREKELITTPPPPPPVITINAK